MDDLLREFLTETNENLDIVDSELVKFERSPNDARILENIFRLVHTIKGTCGFLGLARLEALAHACETLMGKFRGEATITSRHVTIILRSIDQVKAILSELERLNGQEPEGDDKQLIEELETTAAEIDLKPADQEENNEDNRSQQSDRSQSAAGSRPGEASLDELERAFQETKSEVETSAENDAEDTTTHSSDDFCDNTSTEKPPENHDNISPPVSSSETGKNISAKDEISTKKKEDDPGTSARQSTTGNGSNNSPAATIRVAVDTLENLMTMVSELVLTRNQLMEMARRHEDSEFKVPLQRLSNVTAELQEGVMRTRMQPIGNAWQKLPRIVRDLSKELDKPINLQMVGADTELDRQVLELIRDPLTHMIRNSADHGLEAAGERTALGKPEAGQIRLSAYHEGGYIIIEIKDDGRGLDTERIKKKALQSGLASERELNQMSDQQIQRFIFHAGFSTASTVTNVSGRGVGMDVVRNNIELIGGSTDVYSVPGQLTRFTIKIPLTLAIVSTLIVEAGQSRFAIPQLSVVELVRVQKDSEHRIEHIKNVPVLRIRNKLLPLIHLPLLLEQKEEDDESSQEFDISSGFIVIMQVGAQAFGVVVDSVFHTEEIVVKPISSMLRHLTIFSGNTILGDGSVIMIIDPNGIASMMSRKSANIMMDETNEGNDDENEEKTGKAKLISFLIFRAGSAEPKAIPLSLITRLEEFDITDIEHSDGRDLVQYRGSLMPLVYINKSAQEPKGGKRPMLVFSDAGRSMGLVVDEIVDIVDDRLDIEVRSDNPGTLGSSVINGKATEIIDLGYYLPQAFDDWLQRRDSSSAQPVRQILLVDDSSFFRNMLSPVLKSAGYAVTTAPSASAAFEILEKNHEFDAIITDIEMPGIGGFELCSLLRKDERFAKTPIFALSAMMTPEAIELGRQAGFDDYVAKFDRQGLIKTLREALGPDVEIAA